HAEWDAKMRAQEALRQATAPHGTKICAVYTSLFLEDSFGPWFGLATKKGQWDVIHNPDARIPEHVRIGGDTVTVREAAKIFESFNPGHDIHINTIPLKPYKSQLTKGGEGNNEPSGFLRFLMGEGKLDLSDENTRDGGSQNDVVNPGGKLWKWRSVREYAQSVEGKPWPYRDFGHMSQQKVTPLPPYYAAKKAFFRLIKQASSIGSALSVTQDPNLTLESCLGKHGAYSMGIPPVDSRLVDLSDIELQSQFLDCATAMYTMRVGLPAHPDYPRFIADPQVRTKLDTTARELFERLQDLKLEILKRAPVTNPKHQLEVETAWI
ncbi:hypothetical protein FIBSPDRAFT_867224, partial [Athelia psychrophila]